MIFLRSALFNLYFFLLTFVLGLGGLGVRWLAPRRALEYAQVWARLLLGGLRRISGIYPVLIGGEYLPPGGPVLIASQHQSAYDTLVWLTLLSRPAYVMKRELVKIPLFGPLTPLAGMILVDRAGGAAALRGLLGETRRAVAEGRQIVIFPEGTRTLPGERRALQPGVAAMAATVKLPVLPVATDSGLRWGKNAFFKRPGPIHIVVCPPLAAGLPRAALLAGIQAAWDAAPMPLSPRGCG